MSYQLELFDKSEQQIKDEIQYYFDYLQKPSDAFGGMPVCPFLKAELESNKLLVEIWKPNEFSFLDGTILAQGIPYHVMFESDTKTEFYMTGEKHMSDSEFIVRIKGETSFGQYKRLKGVLTSQLYFTPYDFVPLKKDFKSGFSYRFFGRKRFGDKSLIEISEVDYKKNSVMYNTWSHM